MDKSSHLSRNVSILEIQDKERCSYEWDFRIPPRGRIADNIRSLPTGQYHFNNLKFKTGPLANINHSWDLHFDMDKLFVTLSYSQSPNFALVLAGLELQLISKSFTRSTHEFSNPEMELNVDSEPTVVKWTSFWSHQAAIERRSSETPPPPATGGWSKLKANIFKGEQGEFWTDAIDTLRITFTIDIEKPGRCIVNAAYRQNGTVCVFNSI